MIATRSRRVPFQCPNCGFESESSAQITEGSDAGAYECPKCRAVSRLERAYLSGLVGGTLFGGVAGISAVVLFQCCLSEVPIVFSMLSALPLALMLAWWLRPSISKRFDRWKLLDRRTD